MKPEEELLHNLHELNARLDDLKRTELTRADRFTFEGLYRHTMSMRDKIRNGVYTTKFEKCPECKKTRLKE